ncbi:MAG: transporter associated domain-containing protein [Methylococcaceae bacterium]|jgi:magnesium and cobalt transporter|nr:transporter associated domain-containing protein [Methylococcaceae bacterium]MDZ4156513.1 transporter associated domain-containing protein [Methylococcales bacterium]MDP2393034.1 transporter associated domain-containing protein [Methylococcaceae bacterium]MDP3019178.1 transporter associated domain-containing protein [Methylococcaceae bacterium]MDP3389640.1 transporter associated domain-containing protein [Methylococcaceae bacterium]
MSDEQPPSRHSPQRSWVDKISHLLTGEPQDLEDLLEILREAREKRLLDTDALAMIEGVLQVSQMRVRDIMIPRIQMVVLPRDAELETIMPLVTEFGHSRYPVIDGDRSKVVGILLAKDLLAKVFDSKTLTVEEIMRPAVIVPESKRLNVLLKELRTNGNHMAVVVDEYGQAAGLVTIEDVLEQIVGDIEDEHDDHEDEGYIFQRSENEFMIKALTPMDEFDEHFGTALATDEYDTIGGFIVSQLEHMPTKGESLVVDNLRFEVIRTDSRRVYLVKLKIIE